MCYSVHATCNEISLTPWWFPAYMFDLSAPTAPDRMLQCCTDEACETPVVCEAGQVSKY